MIKQVDRSTSRYCNRSQALHGFFLYTQYVPSTAETTYCAMLIRTSSLDMKRPTTTCLNSQQEQTNLEWILVAIIMGLPASGGQSALLFGDSTHGLSLALLHLSPFPE